ncbi:hypothetical protein DFH06DRAFT_1426546 [Mycena polygramma]|nr:hypothetical protein DFH06DRAFT_1426546 [Mycena polygramma]
MWRKYHRGRLREQIWQLNHPASRPVDTDLTQTPENVASRRRETGCIARYTSKNEEAAPAHPHHFLPVWRSKPGRGRRRRPQVNVDVHVPNCLPRELHPVHTGIGVVVMIMALGEDRARFRREDSRSSNPLLMFKKSSVPVYGEDIRKACGEWCLVELEAGERRGRKQQKRVDGGDDWRRKIKVYERKRVSQCAGGKKAVAVEGEGEGQEGGRGVREKTQRRRRSATIGILEGDIGSVGAAVNSVAHDMHDSRKGGRRLCQDLRGASAHVFPDYRSHPQ